MVVSPLGYSLRDYEVLMCVGEIGATRKLKQTVRDAFDMLDSQVFERNRVWFPAHHYSLEQFAYAYQLVLSRSYLVGEPGKERRVIIPLIDMANHRPFPNNEGKDNHMTANAITHFDTKNNRMMLLGKQGVQAGDELFISYGPYSNHELLQNYGFLVPQNQFNCYDLQQDALDSRNLTMGAQLIDQVYDNIVSEPSVIRLQRDHLNGTLKLLWWQRLCHLRMEEIDQHESQIINGTMIHVVNELRAIRGSIDILNQELEQYSTTIEYDQEFLLSHGSGLSHRARLAIEYRLSEKEILRKSIGQLRTMWHYLLQNGEQAAPPIRTTMSLMETHVVPSGEMLQLPDSLQRAQEEAWDALVEQLFTEHAPAAPAPPATPKERPADTKIEDVVYRPIIDFLSPEPPSFTENEQAQHSDGRTRIAVLVASKVDMEVENAYELPFIRILLQSIVRTWSQVDNQRFRLTFFIGFDAGDAFYDSEINMKMLHHALNQISARYPFDFRTICTGNTHGAPAWAWSILGNLAYHEGYEYFFQVNDDVEMNCQHWVSLFVSRLRDQGDIGVVGPTDPRRNLMTQAFVHRTHFQIFDPMYPERFKNWYMDDWMELVYGALANRVDNCFAENSPRPPRYAIDHEAYQYLKEELLQGCIFIQLFLKEGGHPEWANFFCVDVAPTPVVDGSSVKLNPSIYTLLDPPVPPEGFSKLSMVLEAQANEEKELMITFTNFGFLEMTINWVANLDIWNIQNYLIIALDEPSLEKLRAANLPVYYDPRFATSPEAANYLQGHYRQLVNLKTRYNHLILSLGYHTLLCDNDIALLQNPMDLLKASDGWDIQIQDDSSNPEIFAAVNTGFQLVRSNRKTVMFYEMVYGLTQHDESLQDQRAYNSILQSTHFRHLLEWKVLDPLYYPNGWIYFVDRIPQRNHTRPVIIHNNWIRGLESKVHRFREHHLWMVDPPGYYFDPSIRFMTYTAPDTGRSYLSQQEELREAIMMARLLNRTLILPPFDREDQEHSDEFLGYTAETFFDMRALQQAVDLRAHGFLTHPIHTERENGPLRGAHLLDLIGPQDSACYQNRPMNCFRNGHLGHIKVSKSSALRSTVFKWKDLFSLVGPQSSRADVPLLIFPSILGKVIDLKEQFISIEIEEINRATELRAAPHM